MSETRTEDQEENARVLPPANQAYSLPRFPHPESEIDFLKLLGDGFHGKVYRISCGGKTYACKIFQNRWEEPHKEAFFRELFVYANTLHLQPHSIPRCYGYMELSQFSPLPDDVDSAKAQVEAKVVELDEETPASITNPAPEKFDAIILEEIIHREFNVSDLVLPSVLADSGKKILRELHKCGITHGDLEHKQNALIVKMEPDNPNSEEKVVLIDFGYGKLAREVSEEEFKKLASDDLEDWMYDFS